MDFPCFLKRSVPLLGRFLGPGSRDCPGCHRCCCSAEGRPCQRAAPRVSLGQEAAARTEGRSSCRTRCPDVGTPLKTKAQCCNYFLPLKPLNIKPDSGATTPGTSQASQRVITFLWESGWNGEEYKGLKKRKRTSNNRNTQRVDISGWN